ncbi:MAG: hypothetical protein R2911_18140 [Caldilineaceae bacterium]
MLFNLILTVIFSFNVLAALIFVMACAVSGRQSQKEQDAPASSIKSPLSRHYASTPMSASAAAHA